MTTPYSTPEHPAEGDPASPPAAPSTPPSDESVIQSAFGGRRGVLDIGLPSVLFVGTYTLGGQDLRLALVVAVASAAVLAGIRVARKESLQHALGGFLGVGVAAFVASRTGRPQDYYLPGLLMNVGFGLLCLVSIVTRWPVVGVFLGALTQASMSWRRDRVLVRAYTRATAVLLAMFGLRLAVQTPLFLAGEGALGALGTARVVMGVPLYAATLWIAYRVIRASVPPDRSVLPQRAG